MSIGLRDRLQSSSFQPRQDEVIEWVERPVLIPDRWKLRIAHRLKRPVLPAFLKVDRPDRRIGDCLTRIGCSHRDPGFKILDDRVCQLPLRRHLELVVSQRLEEQTLLSLLRHDGRAAVATS